MKHASTLFLKSTLVLIALAVIAFASFFIPQIWLEGLREIPAYATVVHLALAALALTVVPFLTALYQAWKLLVRIDANDAFSASSVHALGNILVCAVAMSVLYALALPLAFVVAQLDDAPGLVLIASAFAAAPLIVATFAAVLRKLVRSAVDMKAEHDFTV